MTIVGDVLRKTSQRLVPLLTDHAQAYAERVLCHLLSTDRTTLYLTAERELSPIEAADLDKIIVRLESHEPLDYILGNSYFYHREFTVSPAVLIPRPDTETLIEIVLQSESKTKKHFADIGTGSGIVASVLCEHSPHWEGLGIDIATDALTIAQKNRTTEQVMVICSDLLTAIKLTAQLDFIVSNPPYIPSATIATLDPSVRNFEPVKALDGGPDGLFFYRYLAQTAPRFLKTGGKCYCEIGYDQRDTVTQLFTRMFWRDVHCHHDLGGHPRVIEATFSGRSNHT